MTLWTPYFIAKFEAMMNIEVLELELQSLKDANFHKITPEKFHHNRD